MICAMFVQKNLVKQTRSHKQRILFYLIDTKVRETSEVQKVQIISTFTGQILPLPAVLLPKKKEKIDFSLIKR